MIDLHSHILPGIDDGARDQFEALEMARLASSDGVTVMACTPHHWPPKFATRGMDVARQTASLQSAIDDHQIKLKLVIGADVHLQAGVLEGLRSGDVPTLNGSNAFLLEPDHDILTPNLVPYARTLRDAGYRPILTHPERLRWIDRHFDIIEALYSAGVLMQLTAGSILGHFGRRAERWAMHMLEQGMVDVVASDAHGARRRPPR
ncbi:MAG: hypothetical protein NXH88_16685, partial [Hyphomonas sp.]|nr:hypothetical protein [Hyphomonas sp.]